jgi:hypothetical protein
MLQTTWAVIKNGKIEPTENFPLPEGAKVIVTFFVEEDEAQFWSLASQRSLSSVWDNAEDDVYAELLQK